MRRLVLVWLGYFAVIVGIALLAGQIAHGQSFDWKPVIVPAVGVSFDTVSTHRCGGEKNPLFQIDGDWRRPDFQKMWRANLIGMAGIVAANGVMHWGRKHDPRSRTLKAAQKVVQGYSYGIGLWRGYAGARNVYRCGW